MSTTERPLDESTATLVSPDDHLHAKNLLNMPSKASTGVSSGTVSTEEPSTPEPPAAELTAPVSIKCGWPNAAEGVEGQPPVPEVKALATEGPEGQPPWGSKGLTAAIQKPQAAPADANSGWPHLDKEQPKTKDANSGWPHFDKEQPETKDADSKWPGDSNNPDDPKHQTGHGTHSSGSDAASKDASGTVTVQCGWPNGTTKPPPTVPGRNDPGSFGPRGQPPWGTQKVATASPEGQPPWGISNLAAANASQPTEGPEGQPPWGSKGLAVAHPDKPTDA